MNPENRSGRYTLVGRIANGQSIEHMDGPLQALAGLLRANFQYPNPQWDKTRNPSIESVREFLVGDVKPSLLATLAAMAAILLIACANVASLMLGQLDARATDIAVRAALGANRQRLVQQLAVESLLIGIVAGLVGALRRRHRIRCARRGASARRACRERQARLDGVLGLHDCRAARSAARGRRSWSRSLARQQPADDAVDDADRRSGQPRRPARRWTRRCADGARRTARRWCGAAHSQRRQPPRNRSGPADRTASPSSMPPCPARLSVDERRRAILSVLPALEAVPGVRAVAAAQKLPLRGSGDNWNIRIVGRPPLNASTAFRMVTPALFRHPRDSHHARPRLPGLRSRGQRAASSSSTRRLRPSSFLGRIRWARCCRHSMRPASGSSASSATPPRRT